jgi:hypothetical protein
MRGRATPVRRFPCAGDPRGKSSLFLKSFLFLSDAVGCITGDRRDGAFVMAVAGHGADVPARGINPHNIAAEYATNGITRRGA